MVTHLLLLDGIGHKAAFVIVGHGARQYYLFAFLIAGPQLLRYLVLVVAYYIIGYVQNSLRTAVVLLQLHHHHVFIVVLELKDVLHRSAAEGIDALRIITHHADILMACAQHFYDGVLGQVGILVLIYKYVAKTVLVLSQRFREVCEQCVHLQQQIIKVHCSVLKALFCIGHIYIAYKRAVAARIFRLYVAVGLVHGRLYEAVLRS